MESIKQPLSAASSSKRSSWASRLLTAACHFNPSNALMTSMARLAYRKICSYFSRFLGFFLGFFGFFFFFFLFFSFFFFAALVAVDFSCSIAAKGAGASTAVNIAINIIHILP